MKTATDVIEFWFGSDANDPLKEKHKWYKKDPEFDQKIADNFSKELELARTKKLTSWQESPKEMLALILLLDQFSRNVYRDQPEAYICDPYAQDLVKEGIDNNFDEQLEPVHRWFFYMPLMHSENLELQNLGLQLFEKLIDVTTGKVKEAMQSVHHYGVLHRDIIARFGRFPHRNEVLGRTSTTEEVAFLQTPNSSF